MSRFRKVDGRLWNDAKFSSLSERAKLVFLFLLTHPSLTMLGAMRATIPGLAAEIGMATDAFRQAFEEVLAKAMAKHDEKASFLWLPNFVKYNRPESPNVIRAWPDAWDLLPECPLKETLAQQLRAFTEGLSEGFRQAFREAFPKGMPNQEQEHEQQQEEPLSSNAAACDGQPPALFPVIQERDGGGAREHENVVEEVFGYYLERVGRSPKTYALTTLRRRKGMARLAECLQKAGGNGNLGNAVKLMKLAVDGLAKSDFHLGRDPKTNGKRFCEWESHLFGSFERMERWWRQ